MILIHVNALIIIIKKTPKKHIKKDTATKNELKGRTTVVSAIVILNNILMDTIYRTSVNVYD